MHLFRATVSVDTSRAIKGRTDELSTVSKLQADQRKIIMGVQGELIVPLHL